MHLQPRIPGLLDYLLASTHDIGALRIDFVLSNESLNLFDNKLENFNSSRVSLTKPPSQSLAQKAKALPHLLKANLLPSSRITTILWVIDWGPFTFFVGVAIGFSSKSIVNQETHLQSVLISERELMILTKNLNFV